ncbi:MAG: hypothetical protein OEV42_01620 [Deltaproteobacteria bacterium]|nr:hypothetical protein [Deltaproteobacteria bacterium]
MGLPLLKLPDGLLALFSLLEPEDKMNRPGNDVAMMVWNPGFI